MCARVHAHTHMHHVLIDACYMLSQIRDRWSQRQPLPPAPLYRATLYSYIRETSAFRQQQPPTATTTATKQGFSVPGILPWQSQLTVKMQTPQDRILLSVS